MMISKAAFAAPLGAALCLASAAVAGPVTTVPWNGYTGAASFTYDDARNSQIPNLLPQLDSLGLKATFFVTGRNVGTFTTRLNEWLGVARNGHEVTNHTYSHMNVTDANAADSILGMATYLRGLDTTIRSLTFAYPNCVVPGNTGKAGVNAENFIARGCANTSYAWGTQPTDWMNVQGLIMQPTNQSTGVNLLNTAKNNRWAIFVVHDVASPTPDEYSITPANNLQLLTTAVANGLWIDTYERIGAYYRAHFTMDTVNALESVAATPGAGWVMRWVSPHSRMPSAVPLRVRLDSMVFGAAFTVRQDNKIVPAQPDGTFIIDFMKLRLDVTPGASALASSRGLPRAIRAAALRASLRPEAPAQGARTLDGKRAGRAAPENGRKYITSSMKITLLTNEYPPHVYGGAGVHVEYLSRALARLQPGENTVEVLSFGDQRETEGDLSVTGVRPDFKLPAQNDKHAKLMDTLARDLIMAGSVRESDVLHGHTWYSHLAGCLAKQLLRAPLVLTTHSLEPHRPWKVEQLGNAYHASTWIEKTAYRNADGVVAVSEAMKRDVQDLYGVAVDRIRVIPNGIDVEEYARKPDPERLRKHGVDPETPFVLFVGRITRQKGILHLLHALKHLPQGTQVALCAGAPDTPEIGEEMKNEVVALRAARADLRVHWIDAMLPREDVIAFYSQAAVFVCPSVYEPFGIINLEAMACGAAVVASRVGGIPEAVADGETGLLVDVDPVGGTNFEPRDPEAFARRLADGITALLENPERRAAFAAAGRARVVEKFSWESVARQTLSFYQETAARYAQENR